VYLLSGATWVRPNHSRRQKDDGTIGERGRRWKEGRRRRVRGQESVVPLYLQFRPTGVELKMGNTKYKKKKTTGGIRKGKGRRDINGSNYFFSGVENMTRAFLAGEPLTGELYGRNGIVGT